MNMIEKPTKQKSKKVIEYEPITFEDILAVRTLTKTRQDFQGIRKKMDNRLGLKASGEKQNVGARTFRDKDIEMFMEISKFCNDKEDELEKNLKAVLKRFPIYNEYLLGVKGVGPVSAGWIIGEFDIHKADTVSKLWQFAGLNPGQVRGMKSIDKNSFKPTMGPIVKQYTTKKGDEQIIYLTDQLVRGDKLTPGFVAPFNKNLRTALVGVMADVFVRTQNEYALNYYNPYKARLVQEESLVLHNGKQVAWKDVSKGHRDRAALRYMIKMFLTDLYVAWRTIEGLTVRVPYQEEYLGHIHHGKVEIPYQIDDNDLE